MVAQEQPPLAAVGDVRGLGEDLGDREALLPAHRHVHARHQREVEAHVALVAGAEVVDDVRGPLVRLGEQHRLPNSASTVARTRLRNVVGLGQVLAVGAVPLEQVRHGVEAEPVQPQVQPEPDHVEHGVGHLGVVVVQVGLVVEEAMPVVLLAAGVPRPVGGLGVDEDDPGVAPALVVVAPDVPVRLGVGAVLTRLGEPGCWIRGVVHHHVGDDADAPGVAGLDELGGVVDGAELGEHAEEVGDVVAAVAQRRLVERAAARGSRPPATRGSRAAR